MSSFGILAISPPSFEQRESFEPVSGEVEFRVADASIALAASLCGETGIIDVEFVNLAHAENIAALNLALKSMQLKGCTRYGVKADCNQIELLRPMLEVTTSKANSTKVEQSESEQQLVVVLVPTKTSDLKKAISTVHAVGGQVIVECVSPAESVAAQAAGADAVIAKGHEAGGRVGEQTTFVLTQECVAQVQIPVYAAGGIGLHTGAACRAAGAAGLVLDAQLLLTRESRLPLELKQKIATMDGTETSLLESSDGNKYRVYVRGGHELLNVTPVVNSVNQAPVIVRADIKAEIVRFGSFESSTERVWLIGQDASFAEKFARKFASVAGVIQAILASSEDHVATAKSQLPLAENSPLAVAHGTKYPIVQGAMTRVSDTAQFALDVAVGGGLPFLALALMRKGEVDALVSKTAELLQDRSWGAGLLGFVPNELRHEQLEVILKYKPPFALIAGGRPDQAKALEDVGIKTYLHVPSPLLLESFIEMGSKRFIFEGKECGGHVGPRSSFILWEAMIDVLLRSVGADASKYHILFAGGVHDALSSAMVSAMAAPLAAKGVKVGVLMGTAYLFTEEAVTSGAIVKPFQSAAIQCKQTVLLETGPGHAIRCIDSPYKRIFDDKRQELTVQSKSRDEIREELELMNLGRLRIASKGVNRASSANKQQIIADLKKDHGKSGGASSDLVSLSEADQWKDGMYMIGQVASLHEEVTTIEKLHADVSVRGSELLHTLNAKKAPTEMSDAAVAEASAVGSSAQAEPIAIVGMSCMFPKANDLETFWQNILAKVDAIEEVPLEQWDWRELYDADPLAPDKVVSKWGGFLKDIEFDPTIYGIPPSSLKSIDPMQVLLLEITRAALEDAGYTERSFPKAKTSVILANSGQGPITAMYSLRSMLGWKLSDLADDVKEHIKAKLPEWSEDSFPGYLGNVTAGRVANRFDLGGVNFSIDAACGSSIAALYVSMADLRNRNSDVVFLCASDTHNQPGDYLSFSKTHALSPTGRCRTFDATADGIAISEGMAMMVLKRLSDAERDGDKIYAVIKGVAGSSDGRALSLTAPRPAGQVLALNRAYEDAGVAPSSVTLVEAHGTGTVAGDRAEIEALKNVFSADGARTQACAVGSVKTMIGHTKSTAGLASLIKVAKALHHKVLPPTIGVTVPNPYCNFESSPFYVNSESRPWLTSLDQNNVMQPRRAGVSAFGFGGTNFHAVLEEYLPPVGTVVESPSKTWPAELFIIRSTSRAELFKPLSMLGDQAKRAQATEDQKASPLKDLAHQFYLKTQEKSGQPSRSTRNSSSDASVADSNKYCLSIVATSLEDLQEKVGRAKSDLLDTNKKHIKDPRGIYYYEPVDGPSEQKVAFVFPGQGSQQVDMLKDLATAFPEMREALQSSTETLASKLPRPLSSFIYPPPAFTDQERNAQLVAITDTHIAQPAIGAASLGMLNLLKAMNVAPLMVAGHSYGEYVALCAAGSLSPSDLLTISEIRGRILSEKKDGTAGTMAAVSSDSAVIKKIMDKLSGVTLANINSPTQCVISGERSSIDNAVSVCKENGLAAKVIPVSQAFHSTHMVHAKEPLKRALDKLDIKSPKLAVYSNADAQVYPSAPEQIAKKLSDHIVAPVDFVHEIQNMYADGARIFVECGPNAVLTGLVSSILEQQNAEDFIAVSTDRSGRHGLTHLLHALAQLAAFGVPVNPGILYRGRVDQNQIFQAGAIGDAAGVKKSKLMYRVNGMKIERIDTTATTTNGAKIASVSTATGSTGNAKAIAMTATPSVKATASSYMTDPSANKNIQQSQINAASTPPQPNGKKVVHGDSTVPFDTKPSQVHQGMSNGGEAQPQHAATTNGAQPALPLGMPQNGMQMPQMQQMPVQFQPAGFHPQPAMNAQGMQSVDQLMMHYQQVMLQMTNSFVMSQQQVMLNYLQSRSGMSNQMARPMMQPQQMMQGGANQNWMQPGMQMPAMNMNVAMPGQNVQAPGWQQFGQQMLPVQQQAQMFNQPTQGVNPFQAPQVNVPAPAVVQATSTASAEQKFESWKASEAETVKSGNGSNGSSNGSNGASNGHGNGAQAAADAVSTAVKFPAAQEVKEEVKEVKAAKPAYDSDALVASLLDIVSQRTGYPPDMLDPTLDLEADLGIDSIKRVEILNSFRKILPEAKQTQLETGIEELAGTKTLEGIIAWIRKEPVDVDADTTAPTAESNGKHPADLNVKIDGEPVNFDVAAKLESEAPVKGANGNGNGNGNGHTNGHGNGNGNGKAALADSNGASKSSIKHDLDEVTRALERTVAIQGEMKRALVKVVDLPKLSAKPALSGTWLITGDASGFAEKIKTVWGKAGAKAVVLTHATKPGDSGINLLDVEKVQQKIAAIKAEHGAINGFVHAAGLANGKDVDSFGAKSLFVVAKALDAGMTAPGANVAGVVVLTRMGGAFESGGKSSVEGSHTQAGTVGVLKSLAKEWSGVKCKAVDFATALTAEQVAQAALEEITAADNRVEIGRGAKLERVGLEIVYAPLTEEALVPSGLDSSSVILVTGGARGITAEIAIDLAEQFQPTLVLIGRAGQPSPDEEVATQGLTTPKELKAAIMDQLRAQNKPLSIAQVESIYQKTLRDREIRQNLRKMESLGSKVHYFSVDVKDESAFAKCIQSVYKQFGKVDGVINGAGIIEDGFVKQKSLESFERVYDTKVTSATTLAKNIKFDALKFMFLFSSVVGRTGNAGQTDYVAANEVVNKLAVELNQKTTARVASLMWGPWKGGMANPELESIFARYGWAMISPEEGKKAFRQELLASHKHEEEVLLVAELIKDIDAPKGTGARLHGIEAQKLSATEHEFHLTLNPAQDVYLKDHTFDGVPVMPMAMALELMAEAVQSVYPGFTCVRVHDLDIPSGIVFDTNSKQISLLVQEQSRNGSTVMVEGSLSLSYPRKRMNFKATFELTEAQAISTNGKGSKPDLSQIPAVIPVSVKGLAELKKLDEPLESGLTVKQIYSDYLFHGPLFQGITEVEAVGVDGIVGQLVVSDPVQCVPTAGCEKWSVDPVLLDSAMQLAGCWVRRFLEITTLPTGFRKLHLVRPLTEKNYLVRAFMDSKITTSNLACHVGVYNESGELVLLVESLGGVGSKSLNRLAASSAASAGSVR